MMARTLNEIKFVRGDTVSWEFTLKDEAGVAIDLTSYDLAVTVRKTATTAAATFSFTTSDFTTTSASSGTVTLNIPATTTASSTAGTYVYDLQITSPAPASRVTTPVCNEKFIIVQDVTYS